MLRRIAIVGLVVACNATSTQAPSSRGESDGGDTTDAPAPATSSSSDATPIDADADTAGGQDGSGEGGSTGTAADGGGGVPTFTPLELALPHGYLLGVYGPGAAWADLDGNGWLDLIAVGGALASTVLRNDQGVLSIADAPDLTTPYDTAGVSTPDYDNDGDPDVYLLRRGDSRLLRNDGGFTFVDVSAASGVGYVGNPSSATWGDFDGDGWLDLFIVTLGTADDVLYRSDGHGGFVDRTDLLPGMTADQTFAATFVDFDDDDDVDLYAVNDKNAGNRMWRNDGPGCGGWCFAEVAAEWGVDTQAFGMGLGVGDFDNDTDVDLSFSDVDKHHLLRREQGETWFTNVAVELGVSYPAHGWGTVFLDADNDGWLELFVADSQLPAAHSRMFRSLEGKMFADISAQSGCVLPGWNFGVAHGDYDVDGADDLVIGTRAVGTRVFRNDDANDRHWLEIDLEGGGAINRDAIGTRVIMQTTSGMTLRRDVEIGTGIASQSSLRLHFGLGDEGISAVEIRWPDGTIESPAVPPIDALWQHTYPSL